MLYRHLIIRILMLSMVSNPKQITLSRPKKVCQIVTHFQLVLICLKVCQIVTHFNSGSEINKRVVILRT